MMHATGLNAISDVETDNSGHPNYSQAMMSERDTKTQAIKSEWEREKQHCEVIPV